MENITDIIEYFGALDYDDNNRGFATLKEMLSKFDDSENSFDEIRVIILNELKEFDRIIQERMEQESFWWTQSKDLQYCHNYAIMWIMSRWFRSAKSMEELPVWYQECCRVNQEKGLMSSIVKELIEIVQQNS
jgi:hypothetical protein